ncbi:MAG: protein kinase [Acidobacteriota bacterium]
MFLKGQKIGKYIILEALGSGGFGSVYLAEDTWISKKVALKIPHKQNSDLINLLKEPRLQAALNHPNIVQILTADKIDGVFVIVMEYIRGETLEAVLNKEGKLRVSKALEYTIQICNGVDHAHEKNVIHRDLRPSNILIGEDGGIKIADFGTSAWIEGIPYATTKIGSPPYMAPEQFSGKSSYASDIYSIGCIFYEMLAGRPPIVDPNPFEIEKRALQGEAIPLSRVNPSVPKEVSSICMKALRPKKEERYQRASEISRDIELYLGKNPYESEISDIKSRIKARENRKEKVCWNCKKIIFSQIEVCPYCGEKQVKS